MALAILSNGLVHLRVHWPPGLGWGAAGGLAYALAEFLADHREGFPAGRPGWLYLVQVAVRVILGAIVGAATLAFGESAAFVSDSPGPRSASSMRLFAIWSWPSMHLA